MIVSIFSREKHFPLRIFARCIAFTMQFNDSRYCFKDRRYSSYNIFQEKGRSQGESRSRGEVPTWRHRIASRHNSRHWNLRSIREIASPMEIFLARLLFAFHNRFIFVFFFFLSISFPRNSCNAKQNRDVAWDHSAIYFRYWRIASDAIFVVAEINWIITFFPELKVSFNQFCKLEECKYIFFSLLLFFFCIAITFVERTRTK